MVNRIVSARCQYEMLAPWREAAAHPQSHPDLHHSFAVHGSVHTTGGRVLRGRITAADFTGPQDVTFGGFNDPGGWTFHKSFEPSQIARQGASAFSAMKGLKDPHDGSTDYQKARRTPESVKAVAENYASLPMHDPKALPHFDSYRKEIKQQHDFMTNHLGIKTQVTDYDPYKDVHEMLHDVNNNKTLKILGTHVTGGHPYLDDETNDQFRAVHDLFGHAATGRSFDRHGEQAAYLAHSQMFSDHARPALATETRGQNSGLIYGGGFQPQKTALLHPHFYTGSGGMHLSYTAAAFDDQWQRGVMKDIDETGGFTRRGDEPAPSSGFMVSIPGAEYVQPRKGLTSQDVADYGIKHQDQLDAHSDLYQGGWADDPHFFHDLSRHHTNMWDAVDDAHEGDQDAFYHLDSGVAPYTHEFLGPGGKDHGHWMASKEDRQ